MRLNNLKTPWNKLTRSSKIAIIEKSNRRRIEAFKNRSSKKTKKKKKKSKKRGKGKRKAPSTAEGLMALKKKMSKEEWENFKMMIDSGQL